jgi:hypothetical protein
VRQPEPHLREVVIGGEETLDPMTLVPVAVHDQDGGCPLRAEPLEGGRVLFHMRADGDEVLGDEAGNLGIRVNLGIQPSASPSHRGGAEVEQQRPPGIPRVANRIIDVFSPLDFHVCTSWRGGCNGDTAMELRLYSDFV